MSHLHLRHGHSLRRNDHQGTGTGRYSHDADLHHHFHSTGHRRCAGGAGRGYSPSAGQSGAGCRFGKEAPTGEGGTGSGGPEHAAERGAYFLGKAYAFHARIALQGCICNSLPRNAGRRVSLVVTGHFKCKYSGVSRFASVNIRCPRGTICRTPLLRFNPSERNPGRIFRKKPFPPANPR